MAKTSKKSSKGKAASQPKRKNRTGPAKPVARAASKDSPPRKTARAGDNGAPVANEAPAKIGINALAAGRTVKNQAGLKAKELESFRALLLAKRRELLGDVSSMEEEALRSPGGGTNLSNLPIHMADMGTDNYEQEFTLGLVEKDRQLLREINIALAKIRDGSYGICEGTGKPISKARLEAKPWARFSIEYARQLEKGLVRG